MDVMLETMTASNYKLKSVPICNYNLRVLQAPCRHDTNVALRILRQLLKSVERSETEFLNKNMQNMHILG
jgi:hypothetical protein